MTNTHEDVVVTASSPGKIIIVGEHFVVHEAYAVAAAINKRVTVIASKDGTRKVRFVSQGRDYYFPGTLARRFFPAPSSVMNEIFERFGKCEEGMSIEIRSEIPRGSGLGSSAAVSVATAAAVTRIMGKKLSLEEISKIAMKGEAAIHGNPSGIDVETSLRGGVVLFSKSSGAKPIAFEKGIEILIAFSGKSRNTSALISSVALIRKKYPNTFAHLVESSSFLSLQAVDALCRGDLPYLGAIMNIAQPILDWIGVSNDKLDRMLEDARSGRVFGAKITGAGGGGSIIVLPRPGTAKEVIDRLEAESKYVFSTLIPQEGLKVEQ